MNKQQLIDKAIAEHRYYRGYLQHLMDTRGRIDDAICTQGEFEYRIRELEAISKLYDEHKQHWYDYKNQKALRFPPVGETCLVNEYDKVEIVGETKDGYKVYKHIDTGFFGMACQITSYKPLDWDGGLKSIIIKSCDITDYDASILTATLLAAGYRKCDNNNPTTHE